MSKLISITAIAVAVLLTALLAVDMSRAARSTSPGAATEQIQAQRVLALTVDFHARLLLAASERLDSTVTQARRSTAADQRVACRHEARRPGSVCPQ